MLHVEALHGNPRTRRCPWPNGKNLCDRRTIYYSWTHVEMIMRRAAATGNSIDRFKTPVLYFRGYHPIEHVHPLEGGVLRLKSRSERRPHLPMEPVRLFYPRLTVETATKAARWATLAIRLAWLARRVKGDPHRLEYADKALTSSPDQTEGLELFKARSSRLFLDHRRHIEEVRRQQIAAS